ncbi:Dabb family protein [Pokkaliibacter plantistimulans]
MLYSEFESVESLRNYAVHPAHTQARTELGNIRIARHEVDYLS